MNAFITKFLINVYKRGVCHNTAVLELIDALMRTSVLRFGDIM